MSTYEEKQNRRRQRYQALANQAEHESLQAFQHSREIGQHIPMGQPILVGHHSEKRHRRDIARIERSMDQGIAAFKQAQYYQDKANAVGEGGISADDQNALPKLREKLAQREASQQAMKQANKAQPGSHPGWELSSNNAQIRRLKSRIAELEAAQEQESSEHEYDGFTLREDVVENRVMFCFESKPPEDTRQVLKFHGFRWSPTNGAWQRQLNQAGRHAAACVVAKLSQHDG